MKEQLAQKSNVRWYEIKKIDAVLGQKEAIAFRKLKTYANDYLASKADLDRQIDKILDPSNTEIAPLLKAYDVVKKNTVFQIKSKSMLEFD